MGLQQQLESLVSGNVKEVTINEALAREQILAHLTNLLLIHFNSIPSGRFIGEDSQDYLVYELNVSDNYYNCSFRLIEFDNFFKLLRV